MKAFPAECNFVLFRAFSDSLLNTGFDEAIIVCCINPAYFPIFFTSGHNDSGAPV